MTDEVTRLWREGKITHDQFQIYMLFEGNDLGRELLKKFILDTFMEKPEMRGAKPDYARHQGRISVWRDIKELIDDIHKEMKHERSNPANTDWRTKEMGR